MGIFTPVDVMVLSGKLDREHPDLAKHMYGGFQKSKD